MPPWTMPKRDCDRFLLSEWLVSGAGKDARATAGWEAGATCLEAGATCLEAGATCLEAGAT